MALEERVSADYRPPIDSNIQPLWRQLDAVLEPSDLEFEVRDEAIVITHDRSAHLHSEIFDVQDLTASNGALLSQRELCELLATAIEPDGWTFSAVHGRLAVENSLQNILAARSLIAYLKDNREHLPRVVNVRSMAKERAGYQRLLDETGNNNDRWRKAYLEFALTSQTVPSQH